MKTNIKHIEPKEADINLWLKQHIPKAYRPLLAVILTGKVKYILIAGGRSTGKTTLASILFSLILSIRLYGSGVVLRKYKSLNKDSTAQSMRKWFDRISKDIGPLEDFKFNKHELYFERAHPDSTIQKVVFEGTDRDGINKIRGKENADGYFSIVWEDEAEDLAGVMSDIEIEQAWQKEKDKNITLSRREGKFKDEGIYPKTMFLYTFNPRVHFSWKSKMFFEKYLDQTPTKENIDLMEKDGIRYAYIPTYEKGNGALIVQNSYIHLMNDEPRFHLDDSTLKEFQTMKRLAPEAYLSDGLGFIMEPKDSIMGDALNLFRKDIPKQYVPTTISVDQGQKDKSVMVIRAREFIVDEAHHFKDLTWNGGVIDEYFVDGKTIKNEIAKGNHMEGVAKKFVDHIVNEYIEVQTEVDNDSLDMKYSFRKIWQEQRRLTIVGGHKDTWLIHSMKKYFQKTYPDYYNNYIRIGTSKKLTTAFKVDSRPKILRTLLYEQKEWLLKDLTPNVYNYFLTLTYENLGNHERLQDFGDAYDVGMLFDIQERLTGDSLFKSLGEWV